MSLILEHHLARQKDFSERTFGPYDRPKRTEGALDHIRKELREIEAAPDDLEEWIDLMILSFEGAMTRGFTPSQIAACLEGKQTKNECRTWPDWRTVEPGKAIEHVRTCNECAAYRDGGRCPECADDGLRSGYPAGTDPLDLHG